MKTVPVPIDRIVLVTSNYSGYLGGECILCGACGWLVDRKGYPYGGVDDRGDLESSSNRLFHKKNCLMNAALAPSRHLGSPGTNPKDA
jgi:hypothetical protein